MNAVAKIQLDGSVRVTELAKALHKGGMTLRATTDGGAEIVKVAAAQKELHDMLKELSSAVAHYENGLFRDQPRAQAYVLTCAKELADYYNREIADILE